MPERLRLHLSDATGRGALTPDGVGRLLAALEGGARAAIVTIEGAPGSFCEGLDLGDARGAAAGVREFRRLLDAIGRFQAPVVALVDGPALGGGAGIAAAADLVLASPRASFALPEALLGLIPAAIFPAIARRVGVARARLLALGYGPIGPEEAFRWGLADEVPADLEAALARHARRFARMERGAIGAMKALVATHFAAPAAYEEEADLRFRGLLEGEPARGRIARFLAGGAPWESDGS